MLLSRTEGSLNSFRAEEFTVQRTQNSKQLTGCFHHLQSISPVSPVSPVACVSIPRSTQPPLAGAPQPLTSPPAPSPRQSSGAQAEVWSSSCHCKGTRGFHNISGFSPGCKMSFKNLREYLAWLYYQYLLITGIYVLEPWEKSIFNSVLFSAIAMVIYTSYVFVPIHLYLALEFFSGIFGDQPKSTMALMN
ncbi:hypothetical protein fugu_011134 [Takifugu bimaculatus]|uniref:Serine palmitoyltransferase small subunit B n=1 Tax=Takifugu bimaculatus TaxID=433685 RepID=A0A4Z2CBY5_9TELE|nr:hypothetical protein fugu_011134 [Takifugu bimaculatus]